MRRRLYLALCLAAMAISYNSTAQTVLSSKDMVAITPMVPDVIELPEHGRKLLTQKMTQVITQNGFGASGNNLILTANVLTTDVQSTGTVPAMMIVNAEASLVLVDVSEGIVLEEMSLNLRGIDKTQDRALIKCINSIAPRTPEVRSFMQRCRGKVIDYYTTRIPALIAKANSMAAMENYDEAIKTLAAVPESVDEYPAVADIIVGFYINKLDLEAKSTILEAKGLAADKNYADAVSLLTTVHPNSTLYASAETLIQEISDKADAEEKARIAEEKAEAERKRAEALADLQSQREYDTATRQSEQEHALRMEAIRLSATVEESTSWTQSLSNWFSGYFGGN